MLQSFVQDAGLRPFAEDIEDLDNFRTTSSESGFEVQVVTVAGLCDTVALPCCRYPSRAWHESSE